MYNYLSKSLLSIPLHISLHVESGSYGQFLFNFLRNFPQWLYYFTFPQTGHKDSNFFTSLPMLIFFSACCFFSSFSLSFYGHPNEYEVVPHCDFDLQFPQRLMTLNIVSYGLLAICISVFGEISIQALCQNKQGFGFSKHLF